MSTAHPSSNAVAATASQLDVDRFRRDHLDGVGDVAMLPTSVDPLRLAQVAAIRGDFCQRACDRMNMALRKCPLGDPVEYPAPKDASWATTNATAAQEALQVVREALHELSLDNPTKSTNKWPKHRNVDPLLFALRELDVSRFDEQLKDDPEAAVRFDCAKLSVEAWMGMKRNCSALSSAAQDYLAKHFPKVQTSSVIFQEDHQMLVVGSIKPALAGLDLALWPRHLFVCDAWANISCPAPEYPERFQMKMRKWESDGKRLCSPKKDNEWKSPLDWVSVPERIDHLLISQGYTSGQSDLRKIIVRYPDDEREDPNAL